MGMSGNRVYSQWNSHLIGIMISKTIGFFGVLTIFRQTHMVLWFLFSRLEVYFRFNHIPVPVARPVWPCSSPPSRRIGPATRLRGRDKAIEFFAGEKWSIKDKKSHSFQEKSHSFNGKSHSFNGKSQSFNGKSHSLTGKSYSFNGKSYSFNGKSNSFNEKSYSFNGI